MNESEILDLIRAAAPESQSLEFKREPYSKAAKPSAKEELLKDVAGMLNSDTGCTLLIGIEENESGRACSLVQVCGAKDHQRQYQQWIVNSISPPPSNVAVDVVRVTGIDLLVVRVPPGTDRPYSYSASSGEPRFPLRVGTHTKWLSSAEIRLLHARKDQPSALEEELNSLERDFVDQAAKFNSAQLVLVAESDANKGSVLSSVFKGHPGDPPFRGFIGVILRHPRLVSEIESIQCQFPLIDFRESKFQLDDGAQAWRIPGLSGGFLLRTQEIQYQTEFVPLARSAHHLAHQLPHSLKPQLPKDWLIRGEDWSWEPEVSWLVWLYSLSWLGRIPSAKLLQRQWVCGGFRCPYAQARPSEELRFIKSLNVAKSGEIQQVLSSDKWTEQWVSEIHQNLFTLSAAALRHLKRGLRVNQDP